MGNSIQKRKFVVKNKTEFNICFLVTEKKLNLDVEDIEPGKVGETKRNVKNFIGKKLYKKIEKGVDKAFGDTMRREHMEQRDRVVLDITPEDKGFKHVLSGQCFRSQKIKQKISTGNLLYLTILTRQFLIQDSLSNNAEGHSRIDDFPVGRNSYNVPLYNVRLKNLEDARGLSINTVKEIIGEKIAVSVIEQKNIESIKS
eukprot:GFUD01031653.1.p1 GENE.GFUD01031653.1~~GFUD01031653.1.p1  ORF type:complete len:200 (-),score=49.54 GFUD01031653.1:2-601(-)